MRFPGEGTRHARPPGIPADLVGYVEESGPPKIPGTFAVGDRVYLSDVRSRDYIVRSIEGEHAEIVAACGCGGPSTVPTRDLIHASLA